MGQGDTLRREGELLERPLPVLQLPNCAVLVCWASEAAQAARLWPGEGFACCVLAGVLSSPRWHCSSAALGPVLHAAS